MSQSQEIKARESCEHELETCRRKRETEKEERMQERQNEKRDVEEMKREIGGKAIEFVESEIMALNETVLKLGAFSNSFFFGSVVCVCVFEIVCVVE